MNCEDLASYTEPAFSGPFQIKLSKDLFTDRILETCTEKQQSSAKPEVANDHTILSTPITMEILYIYFLSITSSSFKRFYSSDLTAQIKVVDFG